MIQPWITSFGRDGRRPLRALRLHDQHVAVRQRVDGPRVAEAGGIGADRQPIGDRRRLAVLPADHLGHLDRRQQRGARLGQDRVGPDLLRDVEAGHRPTTRPTAPAPGSPGPAPSSAVATSPIMAHSNAMAEHHRAPEPDGDDHDQHRQRREHQPLRHDARPAVARVHEAVQKASAEHDEVAEPVPPARCQAPAASIAPAGRRRRPARPARRRRSRRTAARPRSSPTSGSRSASRRCR